MESVVNISEHYAERNICKVMEHLRNIGLENYFNVFINIMEKHQQTLGFNQINSLLLEPESDVHNNLEVNDFSDVEEYNVAEIEGRPKPSSSPHVQPLIEQGGPPFSVSSSRHLVDIFSLFLDDEILEDIVVYSNVRLALLRSKYHQKGNIAMKDIDLRELKGFIGILVMSAVRNDNHSTTKDMWDIVEGNPLYCCTMSERRFALPIRVLQFDNMTTRVERKSEDRLAPIRTVWEHFVANCRRLYSPGPNLTVDEQLVAFRGWCRFEMYIPNKPAK
ncbi:piggyBac transposable element-derived protein 4-like [Palaemon carinicauda]|uniref:piggyBac transposable element-derived protein 4-like n=1 Tax=Palaemon carinicauda TaxID=392227 RepID=UPI0035B65875